VVQAVILRYLAADARVRNQANPCGVCGGQSDTETGFFPTTSVSPVSFHQCFILIFICALSYQDDIRAKLDNIG
jgi:hypothetical protein